MKWRRTFHNYGTALVKFWVHIDKDEQLKRFEARKENPAKLWKLHEEDWRNREKWDLYEEAAEEMFLRTHTPFAPWTIIEGNCKRLCPDQSYGCGDRSDREEDRREGLRGPTCCCPF